MEIGGAQIVDELRGKQVRLLLAYLILNRERQVSREELTVALWSESAPQSQDGALRTLLSRLRAVVGPSVLSGREHLSLLLPEPVWVDLEAARAEVAHALAALEQGDLRSAWALGQVPLNVASRGLLPGTQARWLEPPRRELEELRLQALEVIGRAALGLGGSQLASAERAARALIDIEPYRESSYLLLMEALAAQGNVAEGLRVFEQLRTLLRHELGTLPSPEALAIHERLLNPQPLHAPAGSVAVEGPAALELPAELAARGHGTLIGRIDELDRLERLWAVAGSGRGSPAYGTTAEPARVVVLAGDPGVGKTRLAAELARRVHEAGAVVLAGRAPEESLVPYQPFLEALRHYVVRAPLEDLRSTVREYGSEIARLVPELRRRAPDLLSEEPVVPETERYRLFEAVVGLLSAISRGAPILMFLDDLHWADRPTLLLLRHLARAGDPRRLLILVAYRAVETPPDGFAAAIADLHREQLLSELPLGGLSAAETAELVRVRTGEPPARAFARALHDETEGNPLFVEEIVRHLIDAGVRPSQARPSALQRFGLPEGVKQVIARRLARLEPSAVEWLRAASVIGRDFDAGLLEPVLELGEQEFLDVLDVVLEQGLVGEAGLEPGRYSFSHALIRESLYEGMSAPRRARLHHRVAEALEALGDEREVGALAYHFARAASAADAEKAIAYGLAAGRRAATLLAHEEAAEYFERTLEVLDRFAPEDRARRCELLLLAGEAQVRAEDPSRAWPALRAAARLAEALGDPDALARAAIAASDRYIQQPGEVDEGLIELLERALEWGGEAHTTRRVLLLSRLSSALYFSPARARMDVLSRQAQAIADELGDPASGVHASTARRRALWTPAHLAERLAISTQMLRLAGQTGVLEHGLQAHAWLVVDLLESGDREAVDAQIEAFSAGSARLRQPIYLWQATVWRAMRAILTGQLDLAESLAAEALGTGAPALSVAAPQYYAIQMLGIRREQGRSGELEEVAGQFLAANPDRPAWRAALAEMLLSAGREAEARDMFDELAAADFADIPLDGDWLTSAALLSELAADLADGERAARLYDLLAPFESHVVVVGLGAVCLGAAGRYLGRVAAASGRPQAAAAHLERALALNTRMGAAIEVAHTQVDLAGLAGGAEGERLLTRALASAEELGAARVANRAATLASR